MRTFSVGDWIADDTQIGKVKYVHSDGTLDIVLYSITGERLGRTSPALGGPRDFEPCCGADHWTRIKAPAFPLRRNEYLRNQVTPLET